MQYRPHMSQPARTHPSDTPDNATPGTRRAAAQRLKMRRELSSAAMELFATKGYEATTVDEIAAAAGVARRTFFRHFRSKEEAIFPDHDDTLVRAEAVLDAAPPHENPWTRSAAASRRSCGCTRPPRPCRWPATA